MVWDVAALVRAVGDTLAARFAAVSVRGELSGFSRAGSGHCYFTLKSADDAVALRCAMFRRAAALVDFNPQDGMTVEVRGRLAVYEPRGELQLIVEGMRRDGHGELMEQFLRLKARLESEGLFAAERKRPITPYPRKVGLVTSLDAAALRDVISTFARRAPHVELLVYPAVVQGAEAGGLLAQAVATAARRSEVDTLIVCRGGGSIADLWAFNDERLVRAVAAAPMPVISGVGHETDFTLCDFVADLRAPTPTSAAELAAAARSDSLAHLARTRERMCRRMQERLEREAQRLDHLTSRSRQPAALVRRHVDRLHATASRLAAVLPGRLARERDRLDHLARRFAQARHRQQLLNGQALQLRAARLEALDPARVLSRGYAWLTGAEGRPVVTAREIEPGQALTAVLADGRIGTVVTAVQLGEVVAGTPRSV